MAALLHNSTSWVILTLFGLLLLGAGVFYLERMLFCDASLIFTSIVNEQTFKIQEYRYGAFITQFVPLLTAYLHLPIKLGLLLYSLSFNLFYFGVAALLVLKFKEYGLAVLMGLYFTLFVSDTYFWTNNEIHQGISWMFLCLASLLWWGKKNPSSWLIVPAFFILAFLAIFTHPLVMFPFVFLWGFLLLDARKWPFSIPYSIVLSGILLFLIAAKYITSRKWGGYDSVKMQPIKYMHIWDAWEALISPMAQSFVIKSLTQYWILPIVFLAGIVTLFKQKKYLPLAWTLVMSLGYFIAVCVTFENATWLTFYFETQWMPLTIIVASPFVYYFLPTLRQKYAVLLLCAIFAIRLGYIVASAPKFVERREWIEQKLDEMRAANLSKMVIYNRGEQELNDLLLMDWGLPTESMLASAIAGDEPQLTFVRMPQQEIWRRPDVNTTMISCFENWKYEQLNADYFSFDTLSNYTIINLME